VAAGAGARFHRSGAGRSGESRLSLDVHIACAVTSISEPSLYSAVARDHRVAAERHGQRRRRELERELSAAGVATNAAHPTYRRAMAVTTAAPGNSAVTTPAWFAAFDTAISDGALLDHVTSPVTSCDVPSPV